MFASIASILHAFHHTGMFIKTERRPMFCLWNLATDMSIVASARISFTTVIWRTLLRLLSAGVSRTFVKHKFGLLTLGTIADLRGPWAWDLCISRGGQHLQRSPYCEET